MAIYYLVNFIQHRNSHGLQFVSSLSTLLCQPSRPGAWGAAGGVLSPSKRHRDPKVRAVIDHLAASGLWRLHEAKGGRAHPFGTLMCTQGDCRIPVRSTPKGDSQYKILWRKASTCPHGCAPTGPIPS